MIGTYGHGTHNDFVLIFDPENKLEISPTQVQNICNRQTGIGADGLIRIGKQDSKWFMDYRNSDGSLAEMCGNGIRVMLNTCWTMATKAPGYFQLVRVMASSIYRSQRVGI